MTSFVASEADGRAPDTHRCTVSDDYTSDTWDQRVSAEGLISGASEPSVSARALGVPRYAGVGNSNAVVTDGVVTLKEGGAPIVKTNTKNFMDQYIVSSTYPTGGATSETMSVTRLRP